VSDSPWSASGRARGSRRVSGRVIEVVTVALLALATVGSAWSAFQVATWNGIETDEARVSAASRIEASREYALATQLVAYDASSVTEYAQAVAADDVPLQQFLRSTIVRPAFVPILDSWEAELRAGRTPTNLLQDQDYLDGLFADSQASDEQALAAADRSERAGDNGDDYIRLTLFFASALFFAGITGSFRTRVPKLLLLSLAAVTLAAAGSFLAGYPVA
jgi:hypothetical protein